MRADKLLGVLSALALMLAATEARAFCRTTSVALDPSSGESCSTNGVPLYHPTTCVPYSLLAKDSPIIPNAILSTELAAAFATWTTPNAQCVPGIVAIELAPVSDAVIVGYHPGQHGHNVVGVPPTFNHVSPADRFALVTVTYNPETGEIYDADLELNPTVKWSFSEVPSPDGIDLRSVLTHEAGHMLGIAHSTDPQATMFGAYVPGDTEERTLASDDEAAICAAYPDRGHRSTAAGLIASTPCALAPGNPNNTCADTVLTHGCASSPRRDGSGGVAIAIAIGIAWMRRRRR